MKILRLFSGLIIFAFLAGGLAFPLIALIQNSMGQAEFSSDFFSATTLAIVKATVVQAGISTFLSVAIGLPLGLWVARSQRSRFLLLLPFSVPGLIAAISWIAIFGRSGWMGSLGERWNLVYSFRGVILAHFFLNAPWIALLVSEGAKSIPQNEKDAARLLGAGKLQLFRDIFWPHLRIYLWSGAAQVFSFCAASFAIVLLLGGGPPVQTLETAIFQSIRYGELNTAAALAYAFWQILICFIPWGISVLLLTRSKLPLLQAELSWKKSHANFWASLMALIFLVPYFIPFLDRLSHFGSIKLTETFLPEILRACRLSILLAAFSGIGAVLVSSAFILGIAFSRRSLKRLLILAATLPSGFSVLVLSLGFWLAYSRFIDPFEGSLIAMGCLQIILFFPLAFRWMWSLYENRPERQLEAARTLGASSLRAFISVDWTRWRTSVSFVLALIAGASVGELAAVSFFYSEKLVPLPLLVSRLMQQYRFDEAEWLSALLLILSLGTSALFAWKGFSRSEKGMIG